jgi:putative ABC transport system substrate-binding protein
MRRREFTALLGAAAAWPLAAGAQAAMPIVGFLGAASPGLYEARLRAFRQSLSDVGYAEGRNVAFEYRWADGNAAALPQLANDLVARRVALIVAAGDPSALAAKAATTTTPIIFSGGNDPVRLGLVQTLRRPGANVTGVTSLNIEIMPKRLQLLSEISPGGPAVLLLHPEGNPNSEEQEREWREVSRTLALQLHVLRANRTDEIDAAFAEISAKKLGTLAIGPSALFNLQSRYLGTLAARYAVLALFQTREFVEAGGLISYGGDLAEQYRIAGVYAGRILQGERAADLPVQQATKVELIVNLKAAKANGLDMPPAVLARADEVIE